MIVYGKNTLKEMDISKIRKVYLSKSVKDDIFHFVKENNIKFEIVDNNRLNNLTNGNHQGIVIDVNEYDYYKIEDIDNEDFIVVLDHLEDPHNFGAIIRTCECAGIKTIIIPKDRSVRVNETVMKVSSGALNNIKIVLVNNINNAINYLKEKGYFVYVADMDGEDYNKLDYSGKKCLVVGSEGDGISKIVKDNTDFVVSIPMFGKINSLNVSVATGIIIYKMLGDK